MLQLYSKHTHKVKFYASTCDACFKYHLWAHECTFDKFTFSGYCFQNNSITREGAMPHAPQNFTEEQVSFYLSLITPDFYPSIYSPFRFVAIHLIHPTFDADGATSICTGINASIFFKLECEAERRWPLFVNSILIVYGAFLLLTALWSGLVSKWMDKKNLRSSHKGSQRISKDHKGSHRITT